jgi:hypothetical protein
VNVLRGLAPLLALLAAAAAGAPPAANPMAVDIVARLRAEALAEPDATRREDVLRAAALELPRGLYPAVLDLLVPIPPGSGDLDIVRSIFLRWVWETPDYAARWAAASPPEPFRYEAMMTAGGRWSQIDRARADAWIESLPDHDRDRVRRGVDQFLTRSQMGPPLKS